MARSYDWDAIAADYTAGRALVEIAAAHGCHWKTARRVARVMGIPPRFKRHEDDRLAAVLAAYDADMTYSAIGAKFGLSRCAVAGIVNRNRGDRPIKPSYPQPARAV